MANVLFDSSVWICYLRPKGWTDLKAAVQLAFVEEHVHTCPVVKAEVLIGTRDEAGFARLVGSFRALPDVTITDHVWEAATRLGYTLRRQGLTIPLTDLVIAQAAIENELVLWHVDGHFEQIRAASPLQTRSFLPQKRQTNMKHHKRYLDLEPQSPLLAPRVGGFNRLLDGCIVRRLVQLANF